MAIAPAVSGHRSPERGEGRESRPPKGIAMRMFAGKRGTEPSPSGTVHPHPMGTNLVRRSNCRPDGAGRLTSTWSSKASATSGAKTKPSIEAIGARSSVAPDGSGSMLALCAASRAACDESSSRRSSFGAGVAEGEAGRRPCVVWRPTSSLRETTFALLFAACCCCCRCRCAAAEVPYADGLGGM